MNTDDLQQFQRLVQSPIRSEAREQALKAWEEYKQVKQSSHVQAQKGGGAGVWTKMDYIRSLTAPAIDLSDATLTDVCVGYADLRGARLDRVTFARDLLAWTSLKGANLESASLVDAHMAGVRLMASDLRGADLSGANLADADLSEANLQGANLRNTCLSGANIERANLVGADLHGCHLDGARVYGVSAWDLKGQPASSKDLIVTPSELATITVDDIRVAQFIYLMVNNPEIRNVLDTVTRKVVLILGRFTPERKAVLDALRDNLRQHNLVPVLFDFEKSAERDVTETVTLMARMARFIIADLTEPASIPQELQAIAPHVAVPIRLILAEGYSAYSMSKDFKKYPWVIKPYRYADLAALCANIETQIIQVAEQKRAEIALSQQDEEW